MSPAPILLIEDNEADANTLIQFLEQADVCNPTHVIKDGAAAIAFLEGAVASNTQVSSTIPILIFLDIALPKKSGVEVLLWLRSRPELKNVVAVATSDNNRLAEVAQAYRVGASTFITKPFNYEEFRLAITENPHLCIRPSAGKMMVERVC